MISTLIGELGPWNWFILGLILLTLEISAPGSFFLWFGTAALFVGLVTFGLGGAVFWSWQIQLIAFVILSIVFVIVGRRFMARHRFGKSDAPLLNKRARQMIGCQGILTQAIEQGTGRIKLGDTVWRVAGEDAPVGTKVKVSEIGAGMMLMVEICRD